jgi:hypothetical protein
MAARVCKCHHHQLFIKEKIFMLTLLTLASQVLLNAHKITDKDSWRNFLKELILLSRTDAMKTKTQLDDVHLNVIETALNNDAMFECAYRTIAEQLQTEEILLESADEDTLLEQFEDAAANNPEVIDPIVIVSLISQIISIINAIKANRNR